MKYATISKLGESALKFSKYFDTKFLITSKNT
jgi:hypothetical protein